MTHQWSLWALFLAGFSNNDLHAVLHKLSAHDVALCQELSLSLSSSSMANLVLEAVAVSKLCVHKKCVVWVACNLFLLLANERIKTTLAGNWHLGQNKIAWSEDWLCGCICQPGPPVHPVLWQQW
jgi:hypothetical protein